MNDSYHIILSAGMQTYNVNLTRTDRPELIDVIIAGRGYAISSDQTVHSLIKDRLNALPSKKFANLESLRFALLKATGEVLKIQKVAIRAIKTDEADPHTSTRFVDQQTTDMSKLIRMVRNRFSDNGIRALCRECLAQNNNNPKLALEALRKAFRQAGAGSLSDSIHGMLLKEASDRNVDQIKAFGRGRTVQVVDFLKSLPQTANGTIDLSRMKRIGGGGTQDVYVLRDKPRQFVIKVNKASLEMTSGERAAKYQTDRASYQTLHEAFGDHCTVEQLLLRNVTSGGTMQEAIISVADYEPGFDKDPIGLNADNFDVDTATIDTNDEAYEKLLKSLFFPHEEHSFDLETLKRLVKNPDFIKFANLIQKDPKFKNALKEFLAGFRDYFRQTGQFMDIAGHENIIFYPTNDGWTFKIGTVIKMETTERVADALDWLDRGAMQTEPRGHLGMGVINYGFQWTKVLNILGMMVEMGRIIDDRNVRKISDMWDHPELRKVRGLPPDLVLLSKIRDIVEHHPTDQLVEIFEANHIEPQKDAELLMRILPYISQDKKLVIGKYLHQHLPRATGPESTYEFCSTRYHIGMILKDDKEGKALALECFGDVMNDPKAPHKTVQQAIDELS